MTHYSLLLIVTLLLLSGCAIGHQAYIDYQNRWIGMKLSPDLKPHTSKDAGKLWRSDFVIFGQGFTHITKNADGDLIYHFSRQEILPHFGIKEWVGRCLIYLVIEPETYIIKGWGFDKGGNPLSCRVWL